MYDMQLDYFIFNSLDLNLNFKFIENNVLTLSTGPRYSNITYMVCSIEWQFNNGLPPIMPITDGLRPNCFNLVVFLDIEFNFCTIIATNNVEKSHCARRVN